MKYRAFTILELLTVMLITSLVISAGYMTLNVVGHQFEFFKISAETNEDIQRLEYFLQSDFENAERILRSRDGLELIAEAPVKYIFNNYSIVRVKNELIDSFNYPIDKLSFTFEGNMVDEPDLIVDRLNFKLTIEKMNIPFIIKKWYASDVLMQNEAQWKD